MNRPFVVIHDLLIWFEKMSWSLLRMSSKGVTQEWDQNELYS